MCCVRVCREREESEGGWEREEVEKIRKGKKVEEVEETGEG